jgi:hypothetical protein
MFTLERKIFISNTKNSMKCEETTWWINKPFTSTTYRAYIYVHKGKWFEYYVDVDVRKKRKSADALSCMKKFMEKYVIL